MQEEEPNVKVVKERDPNYQYMALSAYQRMVAGGGGCWTSVGVLLCSYDNTIVQLYSNRPDPLKQELQRGSVLCSSSNASWFSEFTWTVT